MYIVDTNVVSELRKAKHDRANQRVVAWANSVPKSQLYLSAITVLELDMGILSIEKKDPAQASHLKRWLDEQIMPSFNGRILDVNLAVCRRCAKLHVPNRRPDRDAFIAATALTYGMAVVTRNISDFIEMDVKLINPWDY